MFTMPNEIHFSAILVAAFIASASPGPATLTIAGTAMNYGSRYSLAVASGVTCGSLFWSISAALGLGAVMLANAQVFIVLRILGTAYLAFLALKSARSAFSPIEPLTRTIAVAGEGAAFRKGLALHITNPKPIFFFGALYSLGVPANASLWSLLVLIAAMGVQSFVIFHAYALLFSRPSIVIGYRRMRRGFEALFAISFGAAAWKILSFRPS